jgi:hypothetical protein
VHFFLLKYSAVRLSQGVRKELCDADKADITTKKPRLGDAAGTAPAPEGAAVDVACALANLFNSQPPAATILQVKVKQALNQDLPSSAGGAPLAAPLGAAPPAADAGPWAAAPPVSEREPLQRAPCASGAALQPAKRPPARAMPPPAPAAWPPHARPHIASLAEFLRQPQAPQPLPTPGSDPIAPSQPADKAVALLAGVAGLDARVSSVEAAARALAQQVARLEAAAASTTRVIQSMVAQWRDLVVQMQAALAVGQAAAGELRPVPPPGARSCACRQYFLLLTSLADSRTGARALQEQHDDLKREAEQRQKLEQTVAALVEVVRGMAGQRPQARAAGVAAAPPPAPPPAPLPAPETVLVSRGGSETTWAMPQGAVAAEGAAAAAPCGP